MKALASIIQIKTGKSFRRARKASFSKCKSSATTSATIMVLGCRTDVRRFAGQDRKKDCCYSLLISTRHSCIVSDNTGCQQMVPRKPCWGKITLSCLYTMPVCTITTNEIYNKLAQCHMLVANFGQRVWDNYKFQYFVQNI